MSPLARYIQLFATDVLAVGGLDQGMLQEAGIKERINLHKTKISVIVPIYKVEAYLDRCVKSIEGQTYEALEIILVDDGSPDNCPAMCDAWAAKDERIRVIHKKNGGLSDARNAGIEASKGDYLLFVDSDDYIEPVMCEKMLLAAEGAQADIAVCNFYWEYSDHREMQKSLGISGRIISKDNILDDYFSSNKVTMTVAWNKLYRRELFFTPEHIRYPKGLLHEDEFTSYRLLYAGRKTVVLDEPYYHYIQRDGSIMSNYNEKNLHDIMRCAQEYLHWSDRYAPEKRKLMEYAAFNICRFIIGKCEETPNLRHCSRMVRDKVKGIVRQIGDFRKNPYADWKAKVSFVALRLGKYGGMRQIYNCLRSIKHG